MSKTIQLFGPTVRDFQTTVTSVFEVGVGQIPKPRILTFLTKHIRLSEYINYIADIPFSYVLFSLGIAITEKTGMCHDHHIFLLITSARYSDTVRKGELSRLTKC